MAILRMGAGVFLALAMLLVAESANACTQDSDCLSGRVCIRQICVRPVDPGASTRPGSLGANERARTACTKRCDEGNRSCLARQTPISACVGEARQGCNDGCQQRGQSARLCATDCNSSEARWGWETRCTRAGDEGRQACLTENVACIKACQTSVK